MTDKVVLGQLSIDRQLVDLIDQEIAPGTGVDPRSFWNSLEAIVRDLEPVHRQLLKKRDELQNQIDVWYRDQGAGPIDQKVYQEFLKRIGYLVADDGPVHVSTSNVDPEIAELAGPQLVVPVDNARYALNAANARWGSLYDALYGTDVVPDDAGAQRGPTYNPVRGQRVVAYVESFLDQHVALARGSYSAAEQFRLERIANKSRLVVRLTNQGDVGLADPDQFVGYLEQGGELTSVLLRHHGLHIEIQIDKTHPIGRSHRAGVKDVFLESAITTIQDCEDSVAAVDASDKVRVYRNWAGIMQGTLEATVERSGQRFVRRLSSDRSFVGPDGVPFTLPGRSLMLVRNVGIHMYTDAVQYLGRDIPEGFLDAMVTALAALHDLKGDNKLKNSRRGSMYVVKPKLHGPEEVAATVELFSRVESALGLMRNTIKLGIMDEERRTTVNLSACLRQAHDRVVFINTGFLDRTGDEIHTSMESGPMLPKLEIRNTPWILAYEDRNVDVGIAAGLPGRGQIGKGMWTMPDRMKAMVEMKVAHPKSGATTAWVPSPTAATLHALHYHQVKVAARQAELRYRPSASLDNILTPPLMTNRQLGQAEIQKELDNNIQGILGYVVRWVEQGVGCSKVPDINDVGLMEDRATLRISSQHIANWLRHGITNREQVLETFRKMAQVVDRQNSSDPMYRPMATNFEGSLGFQAALDLVFQGCEEPNGYTERVLTMCRRQAKQRESKAPS